MAKPRWTSTAIAGNSSHTTTAPRRIWITSSTGKARAGKRTARWRRRTSQAPTVVARISGETSAPTSRCVYSMIAAVSRGGTSWP